MTKLNSTLQLDFLAISGEYCSCMECDWSGYISDCDFDFEYDEFKDIDRKYLICPKCGGDLNF